MALPSTVYRANIQLSHIDRNHYESLQVTVARHPSETAERLVARLLAYALFADQELVFTKGICAGDEPDLWIKRPDNRVLLWLEVGLPDPERLAKACRHAERVVVLTCGASLATWKKQHLPKLSAIPNLTLLGLEQEFLTRLVSRLERSITWALTVTEGSLYLSLADETLESSLTHISGPEPFAP